MITGKIYRNKPIQTDQNFYQSESQPLRKGNSQQFLQTSSMMDLQISGEGFQREREGWGSAKEYIQRFERRSRERWGALQRRYAQSIEELQQALGQKDEVIRLLRQSLIEKQKIIDDLRKGQLTTSRHLQE